MGINCSLKASTRIIGVILFLSATHTHTHFEYRMAQIWFPTEGTGKIKLFSEIKHKNTRRNTVFKCDTHTHTHTHFECRMAQIWFPTEGAGKIKLFSEIKHKNTRRNTVLSATHTHTLNTGWYEYGSD